MGSDFGKLHDCMVLGLCIVHTSQGYGLLAADLVFCPGSVDFIPEGKILVLFTRGILFKLPPFT